MSQFVINDWKIDRGTGDIRYIGDAHSGTNPSYTLMLNFHRALKDLADNIISVGDDQLDILSSTPSERNTDTVFLLINSFNIDQASVEHLYGGSLSQDSGKEIWTALNVIGSVSDGTVLQVIKNNQFEDSSTAPYWGAVTNGVALNGNLSNNEIMNIMVKIRDNNIDIDNRRIRIQARKLGDTYSEFSVTGTEGVSVAAISTIVDLNNTSTDAEIAAFLVTLDTQGYIGLDVDGDGVDENYYCQFSLNGDPHNNLYEYSKWIQSLDASQQPDQSPLFGMNGMLFRGVTHEINRNTGASDSGTFQAVETVTWTGGTGQMLAIDNIDATSATKMYIQLLTGVMPDDASVLTGSTSSATYTVATSGVTAHVLPPTIVGITTGTNIIGAYGMGIKPADLNSLDKLTDLQSNLNTPPNNVKHFVNGLIVGEDTVLVTPISGSSVDETFDTITTALTTATETQLVATSTIPLDTPISGTIRVFLNVKNNNKRIEYTGYTDKTFTFKNNEDFTTNNAAAGNYWLPTYIDKVAETTSESFTTVYQSDRQLFNRIRDGGNTPTKDFESPATLTSAGSAITVIRTSDA